MGDAAKGMPGRDRDHSDADSGFARNVGLPFFTETTFFKNMYKEADFVANEAANGGRDDGRGGASNMPGAAVGGGGGVTNHAAEKEDG